MRTYLAILSITGALLIQPPVVTAETLTADTILTGGKIITLDPKGTIAQAIAIRSGRILAVGTANDIKPLSRPRTK